MNFVEKTVYDLLKSNPKVKNKVRDIYQSFFDLLPDKKDYFSEDVIVKEGYFWGFHDVSQYSYDETHILSNKLEVSENPVKMPQKNTPLTVGVWDKNFQFFTPIASTLTWNYHKGCRLQWLGRSSDSFIFNSLVDNELGAMIYSVNGSHIYSINYPIDTISPDGKYATSFSYERLNKYMPGYGYLYKDESYMDELAPEKTGLFLIDVEKNARKLIVSIQDVVNIEWEKSMEGAHHYITHTEFSPDGKKISFFHRWTYEDPDKRFTRLFTCNLDGTDLQLSCTSGMVSHYVWDKNHGLLAYCQINNNDGHYIFNDYTLKNAKHVASSLNSDGHQSYVNGTDYFVVDTYPDRRRRAKIYLCNIKSDTVKEIVNVKSPKKFHNPNVYENICCDLHPRVSPLGDYLTFDSVHTGKRSFCVMRLNINDTK